MDSKRLAARAMLQRVVTLTKNAQELQGGSNLTVPSRNTTWNRQSSVNSEVTAALANTPLPPTYALLPQRPFDFCRTQKILQHELDRHCARISKTYRYNPKHCLDLVREIAQQLRRTIRPDLGSNARYKIVIMVTITQIFPNRQTHQSMAIVSRCLWNADTDGSMTVQSNIGHDMSAIVTAFAVYTD
jgi:hypothetical protein